MQRVFSTRLSTSKGTMFPHKDLTFPFGENRLPFPGCSSTLSCFSCHWPARSPCKTASGTHFLRKKVSSLGHLTLGICFFFVGFIPTYCIFFEGSDIWRLCSEFLCNGDEFGGSQAALQFIFDIRGINKHEKQSVLPPLFEHPSWRSEACHGH